MKAVRGGGVKRGDVCYGMLRAAACVDESDHHALMHVWHGQIVREVRQAREDRDERAGGATMLQPLMLRLTRKAAAFAAARPTLLFKPL